jgi:hypothetical protein
MGGSTPEYIGYFFRNFMEIARIWRIFEPNVAICPTGI